MRNQGIGSWTARRARMSPDRMAVVADGREWTYRAASPAQHQVRARAGRARRRRRRPGRLPRAEPPVLPGDPVRRRHARRDLRAAQRPPRAGGAGLHPRRQRHDRARARARPSRDRRRRCARTCGTCSTSTPTTQLLADAPEDPIDEPVDQEDIAVIMYTSGTTGRPKGAALSHANIHWNSFNLLIDVDLAGDEVTLVNAPMFHVAALNQTVLPTLLKGGTVVLMAAFDPGRTLELIAGAPGHLPVRRAGDVPGHRRRAGLGGRRPVVGAHDDLRRRAGARAGHHHLPGARPDVPAGLRPHRVGAERVVPACRGEQAQGRLGRHAVLLHRRAGGRRRRRRRRAGRAGRGASCTARTSCPGTGTSRRRPPRCCPRTAGCAPATSRSPTTRGTSTSATASRT